MHGILLSCHKIDTEGLVFPEAVHMTSSLLKHEKPGEKKGGNVWISLQRSAEGYHRVAMQSFTRITAVVRKTTSQPSPGVYNGEQKWNELTQLAGHLQCRFQWQAAS